MNHSHEPWLWLSDVSCFFRLVYVWHGWSVSVIWLIHIGDMNDSHTWHDLFTCATIVTRWWKPFFPNNACVTWLMHICYQNDLYVNNDSIICVTRLIHKYDMNHFCKRHDSCICFDQVIEAVSSNECMCDMTHSYVWHDSIICATWLIQIRDMKWTIPLTRLIHMSSHPYVIWMCPHLLLCIYIYICPHHICALIHMSHAYDMWCILKTYTYMREHIYIYMRAIHIPYEHHGAYDIYVRKISIIHMGNISIVHTRDISSIIMAPTMYI